jgi:hypothetical protein
VARRRRRGACNRRFDDAEAIYRVALSLHAAVAAIGAACGSRRASMALKARTMRMARRTAAIPISGSHSMRACVIDRSFIA